MNVKFGVFDSDGEEIARLSDSWITPAILTTLENAGVVGDPEDVIVQVYLADEEPAPVFNDGDIYQITFPSGGTYTYLRFGGEWTGDMTDESMAYWFDHNRAVKCVAVPENES
jgi:hypothetical protein